MNFSFPHMADYSVPIERFLRFVFPRDNVILPPPITARTVSLGAKYSPDFVCAPFKYNLGNYIEALEKGADVLFGAGGGCRYGFYGELHEEILKNLGYKFKFVSLISGGESLDIPAIYKVCKSLGSPLSLPSFLYYAALTVKIIKTMDGFDMQIREKAGFDAKNEFSAVKKDFLCQIKTVKSFRDLARLKKICGKRFASVPLSVPEKPLRIGLIGELYGLMEPFANFFLERTLAAYNASLTRFINLSYLVFGQKETPKLVKNSGGYIKYHLGADGTASVTKSRLLAEAGFDGLIHIKPFGCTPEVNAMPALMNISADYGVPVLFLSFDSQTSETGLKTRIEAFCDMLKLSRGREAAADKRETAACR